MKTIIFKISLILLLPIFGPLAHAATYLILAAWALIGPRRAIEALSMVCLLNFLNPSIYSLSGLADNLRWIVVITSFISVILKYYYHRLNFTSTTLWLVLFIVVSCIISMAVSYAPDVSIFKLISFGVTTITIVCAFQLTQDKLLHWREWFLSLFFVVVLVSFPLIFFSVGYTRNQVGFQGILSHPQTYGIFIAPFLAWLYCLLLEKTVLGWRYLLFTGVATFSLFATQSRTGMLAAFGGSLLALFCDIFRHQSSVQRMRQWFFRLLPLILVLAIAVIINFDAVTRLAVTFVLKGQTSYGVSDAFNESRGSLLFKSWANFEDNMFTGIGFGVASDPSNMNIRRDSFLNLPVSASIEKGFAVVAALEEVGIVGFFFLVILVCSLLNPTLKDSSNLSSSSLAFGALLVNFGESVFFSLGGVGLLMWLLIGVAQVMGREVHR